jgi:hypothetical protein
VKNKYAYSIEDSALCWFGCISYLLQPVPRGGESGYKTITKARQRFYDFYGFYHLNEIEKKRKWISMRSSCL